MATITLVKLIRSSVIPRQNENSALILSNPALNHLQRLRKALDNTRKFILSDRTI